MELNIAVPFFIQVVVHSLGADLLRSDRDPLTGLLNRRAFTDGVVGRLVAGTRDDYLAVALIDLDRFKASENALTTFRRLIDQADSAMYTAKRRGGNQTHHAD